MKLAIALNYLRNRGEKQTKGVSHELREQFNELNRKVQTADKDWVANNPQEHERMKGDLYKLAKQMEEGGNTYAAEDKRMLHSQVKQIKHHAEEMDSVIDKQEHIEPWVVSKTGRAASDLSDVTHSLDGNIMKRGGGVEDNFRVDGYMTLSNSGGIEIELDNSGDSLRYRFNNNGTYTEPEETFIAFDIDGEAMFVDGDTEYHLSDFMRAYAKGCMIATGGGVNEYRKGGNIPSIEKKVAEINELIKYANDNKIEVVDESSTWQAPMKYKPIKYSNGVLYIEYDELDLYKYSKGQGKVWKMVKDKVLKDNMQFDNPLNDIARMFRKAVKHHKEYGYYAKGGGVGDDNIYFSVDDDKLDELLIENFRRYVDYKNIDGDMYYVMDQRQYDRFIDLAISNGFDVDSLIDERNSSGEHWVKYKGQQPSFAYKNGGGVDEKDGLYVTGRTREDNTKIGEMIDAEGLYAEFNVREGYWFFPEKRDMYDDLEKLLENHFAEYGINARFEGIFAKGGGVGDKKEMKLYRIETLAKGNKDVLTDREDNLYIYEKGILYNTEDGFKKGPSHRMSKINLTILPYKEYAKGGTLESMEKQLPILELQNVNGYKAYYNAKKTLEKANKEHDNTFQSKKVIDNYSQLLLQAKETYKNNLQKHLGEKMATGGGVNWKKNLTVGMEIMSKNGDIYTISGSVDEKAKDVRVTDYNGGVSYLLLKDIKNKLEKGGPTKAQAKKVGKVMHEWKAGKLHSGSKKGPIVKEQKQAVAIALSEAGLSKDANPTGWKHKRKK